MCYALNTRELALIHCLMLVVVFNGVDMTLHGGGGGTLGREAGGASGNTEVRNLAVGDIVHESYACGRSGERKRNMTAEVRTVDENRLEGTARVMVSPLTSRGVAAALLFEVKSVPVLGGLG